MKTIDKLALAAIILLVVSRVAPVVSNILLMYLSPDLPAKFTYLNRASVLGMIPIVLLINIAVGVWLYREAKRDQSTPWVWFLFGLVFQLTAVAVFYLIRIHDLLKNDNHRNSEQDGSTVRV